MAKRGEKNIISFEGIYGDRQARPDPTFLLAKIVGAQTAYYNGEVPPHAHPGVMQVFIIEKGEFELLGPTQAQRLKGPVLLVIPSTITHGFRFNEDVSGHVVTLSEMRFAALWTAAPKLTSIADQLTVINEFTAYTAAQVIDVVEVIQQEQSRHDGEEEIMLTACLQQLFLIIYRLKLQQHDVLLTEQGHADNNYVRKVQPLIKESKGQITVERLASSLNISAAHLNRLCRQATGLSVSGMINEYLMAEAKKYLSYTNMTVSEIAYLLHFEYPNYFARFFKKHAGQSPQAFRKR